MVNPEPLRQTSISDEQMRPETKKKLLVFAKLGANFMIAPFYLPYGRHEDLDLEVDPSRSMMAFILCTTNTEQIPKAFLFKAR